MENLLIDVLIPVYNGEKYIAKCLDSLISQTYKELRIIIADDGSTDKTAKIINEYQKKYKNIEYYYKANEASISKTRNYLLSKVSSELFTFFDSDDYAEPTYMEELYNLLSIYNADISLCGKIRHLENKKIDIKKLNKHFELISLNKDEAICQMLSSNLYNGTVYCKLFRTKLLGDIKFDENIHYGEDLDFCYKIFKNADKYILSTKKLYHYIIRKGSIVTSKFNTKKLTCLDCYDNILNDLNNNSTAYLCAKSMQGLIAIELLYYTFRDKFKDKQIKSKLKNIIKQSIPYIKKNKYLSSINKKAPLVWWLTKFM